MYYLRLPFLFLIKIYQKTVSPDHGFLAHCFPFGVCKYHPTCSEYGYQAIEKHGIFMGGLLIGWRILRCNPWSKGGIDNIPKKFQITNSKFQTNYKNQITKTNCDL